MTFDFKKFEAEKNKIETHLLNEFKGIQTGVATPQVLDLISVDIYGSKMHISHLSSITVESASNLLIVPYDKTSYKEIEKSINEADIGVSLSTDSSGIRVFFPKPTTESRQKMVKIIKEKLEEARVKIKLLREEFKKEIEKEVKEGLISKDEEKIALENLQTEVNLSHQNLENIYQKKEKDILSL